MTEYLMLSPHARVAGDSLCMSVAGSEIRIDAPRPLLRMLTEHADGTRRTDDWLDQIARHWARADLEPFVASLVEQGFLVDSCDLPAVLWRFASNPRRIGAQPDDAQVARLVADAAVRTLVTDAPPHADADADATPSSSLRIAPEATWLTRALSTRTSKRRFAARPVAPEKIAALLWAGYGASACHAEDAAEQRPVRTVPSAGALYPLDLYLVNLRPLEGLAAGAYRARFAPDRTVQLDALEAGAHEAARAFGDPALVHQAQGLVVIAGDFALSAAKYGPRALSYVALEAGHAAQNVLLQAQALELAAVELGGFIESELARIAGLTAASTPLITIAFGVQDDDAPAAPTKGCVFEWLDLNTPGYTLPFTIGQARADGAEWSWGRDRNPSRAWLKAIMEAHERKACIRPGELIDARRGDWADALDPAALASYAPHQYRRPDFPFVPFDPQTRYDWVTGIDVATGEPVGVPADFVFYSAALRPGRAKLTAVTSSGVAAHDEHHRALENAVLELLERDAFMRAWLGRLPPAAIAPNSLPVEFRARLAALNDAGVEVWIRALDTAPFAGMFVAAQSVQRHFTRVASDVALDAHTALDRALMELEAAVAASLAFAGRAPLAPRAVTSSQDHARLYAQQRYFRRADWFIAADGASIDFRALEQHRVAADAVCDTLTALGHRIVAVDLSQPDEAGPHVVRALMPGRVPLSFGYGLEPEGMAGTTGQRRRHALFPHPFI
jgi:ribosomal protein S12 methylthiotransferase accessory factor